MLQKIVFCFIIVGIAMTIEKVQGQCEGKRNENPVLELKPKILKTVANGQKWKMEFENNFVYIAKVRGTAYEMGKAYGELFAEELKVQFTNINYLYPDIMKNLLPNFGVSQEVANLLSKDQLTKLCGIALDVNWKVASPYIP